MAPPVAEGAEHRLRDWAAVCGVATAIVAAITALVFNAVSATATNRQMELARQGQFTDRYTAAVGQLGDRSADVRLGGIYALERLAQDSPTDEHTIVEVLSGFVRGNAEHRGRRPTPVKEDVGAALTVVRRLARANLANAFMQQANLRNANLCSADLSGANLRGADLTDALLDGANLQSADLGGATAAADLFRADLSSADLRDADLNLATLSEANLTSALLSNANLQSADLTYANLSEADLRNANLSGAGLAGANLYNADLTGADLRDADLTGAILEGANLTVTRMKGAKITGSNTAPSPPPPMMSACDIDPS